jgi:histidinol-phosphate aminotransferase
VSFQLSRRRFLGQSSLVAAAAAVGGGQLVTLAPSAQAASLDLRYGPATGVAKLNANENPYGPSREAVAAMTAAINQGAYYVGPTVPMLMDMIAERNGLTRDHISLSSGSSGVLTSLAIAKAPKGKILGPDLFWDTTSRKAIGQGVGEIKRLPKTKDLTVDLDALYNAITDDVAMVQICNPNNPTAIMSDPDELRAFCIKASKKCTVLVDEAYNEITDNPEKNSMVSLVKEGYDVYVAKTFSKIYGMAGMRVGYMMAAPEKIEEIERFGLGSYAMNQAGVAGAVASYNDHKFLEYSRNKIWEARDMINDAVKKNGLSAAPSQTSFVFVNLGSLNAETFRQEMAKQNVLVRGIYQDYTGWSRVSTGRIPDVQRYVDALPRVLEAMGA